MKNHKKIFWLLISFILVLSIVSCKDEDEIENQSPTCEITTPNFGDEFAQGDIVTISVDASDPDGSIKEVRFYIDDVGKSSTKNFPYNYDWDTSDTDFGSHTIKVVAIDDKNNEATSSIDVTLIDGKYIMYDGVKYQLTNATIIKFIDENNTVGGYWVDLSTGVTYQGTNNDRGGSSGHLIDFRGENQFFYNLLNDIPNNSTNFITAEGEIILNFTNLNTDNETIGIYDDFENKSISIKKVNDKYEISLDLETNENKQLKVFYLGDVNIVEW